MWLYNQSTIPLPQSFNEFTQYWGLQAWTLSNLWYDVQNKSLLDGPYVQSAQENLERKGHKSCNKRKFTTYVDIVPNVEEK